MSLQGNSATGGQRTRQQRDIGQHADPGVDDRPVAVSLRSTAIGVLK